MYARVKGKKVRGVAANNLGRIPRSSYLQKLQRIDICFVP